MTPSRELLFGTVFWGPWHRDAFLDVELPSLLSANNLPRLANDHRITFRIFTSRTDRRVVESSEAFAQLKACATVEIIEGDDFSAERRFPIHHNFWNDCIRDARRASALLFLLPPDLCFSDGSLVDIARRLEAGKTAVYVTGVRVTSDTFIPALRRDFFPPGGTATALDSGKLAQLAVAHGHPFNNALQTDSPHGPYISEMILYPVANTGWVKHCFIAGPIMFLDPDRVEMDDYQVVTGVPKDGDFDVVFDDRDATFVSLSPVNLYGDWYFAERPENDFIKAVRRTVRYDSLSSQEVSRDLFEIGGDRDTQAWREAKAKAQNQAAHIQSIVTLLEFARACSRAGFRTVAELVGLLAASGRTLPALDQQGNILCALPADGDSFRRDIVSRIKSSGLDAAANHLLDCFLLRDGDTVQGIGGKTTNARLDGDALLIDSQAHHLSTRVGNIALYRAIASTRPH